MYTSATLITVLIFLIIVNLIAVIVLFRVNRRRKKQNEKLIAGWQQENQYMDHTVEFCREAGKLTEMVRLSIENSGSQTAEQNCLDECSQLLGSIHGGSSAQEALIIEKKSRCDTLGIRFIDEIRALPEDGMIQEIDIISLMGNLLDNAVEACAACISADAGRTISTACPADAGRTECITGSESDEIRPTESNAGSNPAGTDTGMPFIRVESEIRKKVWCFTVTNSKNPAIDLKDGAMPTTKEDTRNHGLGVGIVKSTVSRYNGVLKMNDLGSTFKTEAQLFTRKKRRGRKQ